MDKRVTRPHAGATSTVETVAPSVAAANPSSKTISPSLISKLKRFVFFFSTVTAISFAVSKRLQIPLSIMLFSINTFLHERLYDFTGASTFLVTTAFSLVSSHPDVVQRLHSFEWSSPFSDPFCRNLVITAAVIAWAIRLGSFLFIRVLQVGKDPRFDSVRNNKFRFFIFWHIQALWVFMTTLPIHVTNFYRHISQQDPPSWNAVDSIGLAVWVIGFAIEVISDHQKSNFRKQHHGSKEPKWICTGLWAYSRHPNYCGEVLAWIGVALMCCSTMTLWGYTALLSPLFVYALLTKVSGVPMLEAKAEKIWGNNPQYQKYKASTPVMFF